MLVPSSRGAFERRADASLRRIAPRVVLASLLAFGAAIGLSGCARDNMGPDLLNVVDVTPRTVDLGDRIEVLGMNLPTAEAKEAIVTFRGELRRPGQKPLLDQEITADRAQLESDKVAVAVTPGLEARFCGQGDDALHTTFHGDVTVRLPSNSELVVKGTVKDVTIDFRPPTPRRAIVEAREREGQRALAFLGIGVSRESPPSGGLLITEVREGSPAAKAEIQAGDVIASFEGVQVASVADLIPSGHERMPAIGLKRGGEPIKLRRISIEAYDLRPPADLLGAGMLLSVVAAILLLFMAPSAGVFAWLERRLSALVPASVGPVRAGQQALFAWLRDRARFCLRGGLPEAKGKSLLARIVPYLFFVGASATFLSLPISRTIAPDLDVGVLFIVAVTALITIGVMTGGPSPTGSWSFLGSIRSAAQIVSCEIPSAIAIASIVVMTGSLRVQDIIEAQSGSGGGIITSGGWPWHWYVFRTPVTFALFFLYFTAIFAQSGAVASSLPEADSEPTLGDDGPHGVRSSFTLFADQANVLVMSAVASALFLGGWQLPGISPGEQSARFGLEALGALFYLGKSWALVLVVISLRSMLPRVHGGAVSGLCWKWLVPLSLLALFFVALSAALPPNNILELVISLATLATALLAVAYFVRRVQLRLARVGAPMHLNPFL